TVSARIWDSGVREWQILSAYVNVFLLMSQTLVGLLEQNPCPQKNLGKMASCKLKIRFWETGVPVRVRPRPPHTSASVALMMPAADQDDVRLRNGAISKSWIYSIRR